MKTPLQTVATQCIRSFLTLFIVWGVVTFPNADAPDLPLPTVACAAPPPKPACIEPALYKKIVAASPGNKGVEIARVYCLAGQKQGQAALALAAALSRKYPDDPEVMFAQAYAYEQQGRFLYALDIYDRILAIFPKHRIARELRIIAMSDMGFSSQALELAENDFPRDRAMRNRILADMAVDAIHWQEPDIALSYLQNLPGETINRDRIIALVDAQKPQEALSACERYPLDQQPAWVLESVAQALLDCHQPDKALKTYEQALARQPLSWTGREGKLNALRDLRVWDEAESLLQQLEADAMAAVQHAPSQQNHERTLNLSIERGWFLAHQNRLAAADEHLEQLRHTVPANLDVRNAQAHVHLWRGWPRKAKREFDIIAAMAPDYLPMQPGRLAAVNALNAKASARKQLQSLQIQYPRNKHLARLSHQFQVEQMNELETKVHVLHDDDEAYEVHIGSRLATPINPATRLAVFVAWRRSWVDHPDHEQAAMGDDEPTLWRRAGVGIDHRFNAGWRICQDVSINYDDGRDLGSLTRLTATPDDHWTIDLTYDSFSMDIAKRARAAGIHAKSAQVDLAFRESEWRRVYTTYHFQDYSDGNDREQAWIGYGQNMWVDGDWRIRLNVDLYLTRNSKGGESDIDYFNPRTAWSPSITPMVEHTIGQYLDRSMRHRLFLTAGLYKQDGFDGGLVGGIRYEQELPFAQRHCLMWGLNLNRQLYDGDTVSEAAVDLVYLWRF